MEITIYLAGKIKKAHEKLNESYWTVEDLNHLKDLLNPIEIFFFNPAIRSDNLEDQKSVFGRDMLQVYCSDIVFVDARDRRGLGVGAEMMWAKLNKIPVVTLAPKETHYHKSKTFLLDVLVKNWVHPFVENLSDIVVSDISKGAEWIRAFVDGKIDKIKGPEFMKESMRYYQDTQFHKDMPMQKLYDLSKSLESRFDGLKKSS